jgi:hypothetical protein
MSDETKSPTRTIAIVVVVILVIAGGGLAAWKLTRDEGRSNPIPDEVRPDVRSAVIDSLATELEVEATDVERALQGDQLAELAEDSGTDTSALLETARAAARDALEEAASDGTISDDVVDAGVETMVEAVERHL